MHDPLQEYLKQESAKQYDFEPWEIKKDRIMEKFEKVNENMEVIMNEGGDKDIDRPIRLGKGKSRMDQLEKKNLKARVIVFRIILLSFPRLRPKSSRNSSTN